MYIPKDNDMLYSMINMKLRDQYESFDELCGCEDLDAASLIVRLNAAGYEYDEGHNKFTPVMDEVAPTNEESEKQQNTSAIEESKSH